MTDADESGGAQACAPRGNFGEGPGRDPEEALANAPDGGPDGNRDGAAAGLAGGRSYVNHAPEIWAEARRLYEETETPVLSIVERLGVSDSQVHNRARKHGWVRRSEVASALAEASPQARAQMVARLYRAFEKQVARLEDRLGRLMAREARHDPAGDGRGEAAAGIESLAEVDRTAKTLASLARTLDMLLALQKARAEETRHDVDPDALRQELAQRLGRLPEGGPDRGGSGRADAPGDGVPAA
ncbi:hypothetical protein [Polymorphum gilvum]|uniref:Uncharacterized protein n=1 Tax=Polymorphum gilvum (strain LMG 25793 / CGMCC 1.9160 / SL003B-26A1) TaxID=991905 RepID=F2IV25_POLGS|nr:hypothetical protein [Polymorphum gilvum]ADZ71356.1 hypothetical protein SL003B_2933 [Polymorphum gilvum SL003B-26A1]